MFLFLYSYDRSKINSFSNTIRKCNITATFLFDMISRHRNESLCNYFSIGSHFLSEKGQLNNDLN